MIRTSLLLMIIILQFIHFGCVSQGAPRPSVSAQQKALTLIDKGTLFLRKRSFREARAAFQVSYELNTSSEALDGLGSVAFLEGDLELARDYFISAYELDGTYGRALSHLALLYDYIGESEAARHLYRRALRIQPDEALERSNHAVLLYEQNFYKEAKNEFFRAYSVIPHDIIVTNLKRSGEALGGHYEER